MWRIGSPNQIEEKKAELDLVAELQQLVPKGAGSETLALMARHIEAFELDKALLVSRELEAALMS